MRHQVDLRNLQPNTTYYFRIDTGQGTAAAASVDSVNGFQTTALGANPIRNQPPFKGSMQPAPSSVPGQAASTPEFGNISVTRGPTIQYLDDTTAVISWTTNVPASNTLVLRAGPFEPALHRRRFQGRYRASHTPFQPQAEYRYYFEFDEPSSTQPVASFTTISPGAQPLYDQQPSATFAGGTSGGGPQLTHREHAAGHTNGCRREPRSTPIWRRSVNQDIAAWRPFLGNNLATGPRYQRSDRDSYWRSHQRPGNGIGRGQEPPHAPRTRQAQHAVRKPSRCRTAKLPISATLLSVNRLGGNGSVNAEGEVQSETKASTAAKGVGVGAGIGTIAGLIFGGPLKVWPSAPSPAADTSSLPRAKTWNFRKTAG